MENTNSSTERPDLSYRIGLLSLDVYIKEVSDKDGNARKTATAYPKRSYKKDGKWHTMKGFYPEDYPIVAELFRKAHLDGISVTHPKEEARKATAKKQDAHPDDAA